MSLAVEYRAEFTDINTVDWKIDFLTEAYAGSIKTMRLSGTPLWFDFLSASEKLVEAPIKGSMITVKVLSDTDFQYSTMYADSAFQIAVKIYYKVAEEDEVLYWVGWVAPGTYSEPYDGVVYEVSIACNDGLGALKNIPFDDDGVYYDGRKFESQIVLDILNKIYVTSFSEYLNIYQETMYSGSAYSPLDQTKIDVDVFKDMNCYEVLSHLLVKKNAVIRQYLGVYHIYRPFELIYPLVYGRNFTAFDTKTSVNIVTEQLVSRPGEITDFLSVEGGMMMIEEAAKKITITQNYGNKESWLDNWELSADTYIDGDFLYWTQTNGSHARPISNYVPDEKNGVAIVDTAYPDIYDFRQICGENSKFSNSDKFIIEFDYGVFKTTSGSQSNVQIALELKQGSYRLIPDSNDTAEWVTGGTNVFDFSVTAAEGWSGWTSVKYMFTGLPGNGDILFRFIGTVYPATLHGCIRNVRLYMTSQGIQEKKVRKSLRQRLKAFATGGFPALREKYQTVQYKEVIENAVEDVEVFGTALFGVDLEYDYILGACPDDDIDDNSLEQFAGSLAYSNAAETLFIRALNWTTDNVNFIQLKKIIGAELEAQYSRPSQRISLPIIDKGSAPALSLIKNIQDSYNQVNSVNRYFAINSASFNVRDREWMLELSEIVPAGDIPVYPDGDATDLAATAFSDVRIDLEWTDDCDNEDGFKIERSEDGTNFVVIHTTAANATTYSDVGLDPATLYYYRVRSFKTIYYGDYTTDSATTDAAVDPTVEVVKAPGMTFSMADLGGSITIGNDQLTFSFTDVDDFAVSPGDTMYYDITDAALNTVGTGSIADVYDDPDEEYGDVCTLTRNAVSSDEFTVILYTL